jgi:uncharacterized protein DUF1161
VKLFLTPALALLATSSLFAQSSKPCEDLKAEIAKKLDANNVKSYSLDIMPTGKVKDAEKVVGSCDGGAKKIVYSRTAASAQASTQTTAAAQPSKPLVETKGPASCKKKGRIPIVWNAASLIPILFLP